MEDIKRVISFDSVEEFWGYVILTMMDGDRMTFTFEQLVQQHRATITAAPESQLLLVQGTRFC